MASRLQSGGRPEPLRYILAEVLRLRGFQFGVRRRLAELWLAAAGSDVAARTRVGRLRQGTLEIFVEDAVLRHELTAFRKEELERRLAELSGGRVRQLRFRSA